MHPVPIIIWGKELPFLSFLDFFCFYTKLRKSMDAPTDLGEPVGRQFRNVIEVPAATILIITPEAVYLNI